MLSLEIPVSRLGDILAEYGHRRISRRTFSQEPQFQCCRLGGLATGGKIVKWVLVALGGQEVLRASVEPT